MQYRKIAIKYLIGFIITSYILLFTACASTSKKFEPVVINEINKNFDFSGVKSIGIYIYPTFHPIIDGTLKNILALHFITLGYQIVDLNNALSPKKSLIPFRLIPSDPVKGVESLNHKIKKLGINVDVLVTANSKVWRKMFKYENIYLSLRLYIPINYVTNIINVFDTKSLSFIASGESTSATRIYFLDSTKTKISDKTFPYIQDPIQINLARNVSTILGNFRPQIEDNRITTKINYRFPVIFLADKNYREYYGESWETMISRRMLFANDVIQKQFDIEFYIDRFGEVDISGIDSLEVFFEKIEELTTSNDNVIFIGIVHDPNLMGEIQKPHVVGRSDFLGNVIVIKDVPSLPGVEAWDSINESLILAHELGHLLGASHILEPTSIMFPLSRPFNYQFDEYNRRIVDSVKTGFLQFNSPQDYIEKINQIITIYDEEHFSNVSIVGTIGSIVHKCKAKFEYPLDSIKSKIANPAFYYAGLGAQYLIDEEYESALKMFKYSLKIDTNIPEVYHYLGYTHKKLGHNWHARYYNGKAIRKGFKTNIKTLIP